MINNNSFLNSIFKIKNSKILILILMCSFTSQSLSKSEHSLSNYESFKLKEKIWLRGISLTDVSPLGHQIDRNFSCFKKNIQKALTKS